MKSIVVTILLFAGSSWGLEIAVKVKSQFCGNDRSALLGSGWIFRRGTDTYVATSEHVVIHAPGADELVCHSVLSSRGWIPAQLVLADWGNGLALFKVHAEKQNLQLVQLEQVTAFQESARDLSTMSVYGFPLNAKASYEDHKGRLLTLTSNRHLIPLIDKTYELIGVHGEFGMSGGPVTADGNPRLIVGLLSHQYIEQQPGHAAHVGEFSSSVTLETNHLIVIPGEYVLSWLSSYFAKPSAFTASFVRTVDPTTLVSHSIQAAGLVFKAVEASPSLFPGQTTMNVGAIGGEGSGVGGESVSRPGVVITVEGGAGLLPTDWYLPARMDWIKKLKESLDLQNQIRIPFVLERNPDTHRLRKLMISSISDFFLKLKNPQITPVVALSGPILGEFEKRNEALVSLSARLRSRLKNFTDKKFDSSTLQFLAQLRDMLDVIETDGWLAINDQDLQASLQISGSEMNSWKALFMANFDEAVGLLQDLNQLSCLSSYRCSRSSR